LNCRMSDNEGEGSGGGRDKGEMSESGMSPPKHLVMGQEDMMKAWEIWVRQFDWYAAAFRSTLKGAEVQVGIFMSSLGPGVTKIFDAFGLSAAEEKVVATIRRRFEEYCTPNMNISLQR
jgi:hypothetical protein